MLSKKDLTSPSWLCFTWAHTNTARLQLYFFFKKCVMCPWLDISSESLSSFKMCFCYSHSTRGEGTIWKKDLLFAAGWVVWRSLMLYISESGWEVPLLTEKESVWWQTLWQRNSSPNIGRNVLKDTCYRRVFNIDIVPQIHSSRKPCLMLVNYLARPKCEWNSVTLTLCWLQTYMRHIVKRHRNEWKKCCIVKCDLMCFSAEPVLK